MSKFAALQLAVDKTCRLPLLHPVTRKPLVDAQNKQAYIEHYSIDSEPARKHKQSIVDERLEMRGRATVTGQQLDTEGFALLAALTAGWYLLGLDGAPLEVPFTAENARELYAEPGAAWIVEQLDKSAGERRNFVKASSPT